MLDGETYFWASCGTISSARSHRDIESLLTPIFLARTICEGYFSGWLSRRYLQTLPFSIALRSSRWTFSIRFSWTTSSSLYCLMMAGTFWSPACWHAL